MARPGTTSKAKHDALYRPGKRTPLRLAEMPRWHGWGERSEALRIAKWCEEVLRVPVGLNQGQPFKVPAFQRQILKTLVDSLATFVSIAAGNGKTTFMAAVALERLARGDDYVEVDVLATKEDQAQRLVEAAIRLIECAPELHPLFDYRARECILEYRPTGSKMQAHSARLSAVQGLNFSLALVDEIGFVPSEIVTAMLARLGKRPDARVIGFGTPGTADDNMLERMRELAHSEGLPAGVKFVEFMAEPGCAVDDREQWRKANPAIRAGFLREEALAVQAATMSEHEFRMYHLGQPVESSGPWLPHEAWARCPHADAPPDGAQVVLAVWGNYRRQVSVAGCTLDGAVFFGWQSDSPTDLELGNVLRQACEQWEVLSLVHKAHIRLGLMVQLDEEGLPVEAWPGDRVSDVDSTAALYQAITFGEVAHDHHPVLSEQVARLSAQIDRQGNPRLLESELEVSAALAARAAWWKARLVAESAPNEELVIW